MPEGMESPRVEFCGNCAMKNLKFGEKANFIRRAQGLTLSKLSSLSGVPEKTVERICSGHNAPSAAHFVRLVKALSIDLDVIEPSDLEREAE